jgi:hypothetical protein
MPPIFSAYEVRSLQLFCIACTALFMPAQGFGGKKESLHEET